MDQYLAFISYSHKDRKWGDWLHRSLERYRVPGKLVGKETRLGPVPGKIFPVFRDREELPTSSNLSDAIQDAVKRSRTLIVVCSPNSAGSRWVDEEVLLFKRIHGEDNILAIIVDGEPNASDRPEDQARECFPPALRYRMGKSGRLTKTRTEPIAADVRDTADGRDDALLKLIAGVLAVNFNELKQRELAEARRRARRAQMIAASMAALAVIATGAGWYAWNKSIEVLQAQAEAKRSWAQRTANNARDALLRDDTPDALRLLTNGLSTADLEPDVSTRTYPLLQAALASTSAPQTVQLADRGVTLAVSASGKSVAVGGGGKKDHWGELYIFNGEDLSLRSKGRKAGDIPRHLQFDPAGSEKLLVQSLVDVHVVDTSSGKDILPEEVAGSLDGTNDAAFLPDGKSFAVATTGSEIRQYSLPLGELLRVYRGKNLDELTAKLKQKAGPMFSTMGETFFSLTGSIQDIAVSPDGGTIAGAGMSDPLNSLYLVTSDGGGRHLTGGSEGEIEGVLSSRDNRLQFAPDGKSVVSFTHPDTIKLWSVDESRLSAQFPAAGVVTGAPTADGKAIVSAHEDGTLAFQCADGLNWHHTVKAHRQGLVKAIFDYEQAIVVTGSNETEIRFWALPDGSEVCSGQSRLSSLLPLRTLKGDPGLLDMKLMPNGDLLTLHTSNRLNRWPAWDSELGERTRFPADDADHFFSLKSRDAGAGTNLEKYTIVSRSLKFALSRHTGPDFPQIYDLVNLETSSKVATIDLSEFYLAHFAITEDERYLLVCGTFDGKARTAAKLIYFDLSSGAGVRTLDIPMRADEMRSIDGRTIFVRSGDTQFVLRLRQDGSLDVTEIFRKDAEKHSHVDFLSSSEEFLYAGQDRRIGKRAAYSTSTPLGSLVLDQPLLTMSGQVVLLKADAKGDFFIAADENNAVVLFDVKRNEIVRRFVLPRRVAGAAFDRTSGHAIVCDEADICHYFKVYAYGLEQVREVLAAEEAKRFTWPGASD